jgi:hypothetical protein
MELAKKFLIVLAKWLKKKWEKLFYYAYSSQSLTEPLPDQKQIQVLCSKRQ